MVRTAFLLRKSEALETKAWAVGALALALLLPVSPKAQEGAEDKAYLEGRLSKILEFERTGAEIPWSNPKTGNSGNIQLKRTYFLNPNSPCRDYVRSIDTEGGEPETVRGTGCREADGRWKLTEDAEPKRTVKRGPAEKEKKTAAATPGGGGAPSAKAPAGADGAPARPEGAKAAATAAKPAAADKAPAAPAKAVPKAPPPPPKISARVPAPLPEWEAASDNAY